MLLASKVFCRLCQKIEHRRYTLEAPKDAPNSRPLTLAFRLHSENPQTDHLSTPILILHGVLGSKDNWRSMANRMSAETGRRVYSLDARNHGESPHCSEHSPRLMAADLAEFVSQHGLKRVCAMGHCMGGKGMMKFSLHYPQMVERAIFVDISMVEEPTMAKVVEEIFDVISTMQLPPNKSLREGRTLALRELKLVMRNTPGADMIVKNLRKDSNTGEFYWVCNFPALRRNWAELANVHKTITAKSPYQGPVLFIAGTHSKFFQTSHMAGIRQWFPQAKVQWLKAGHLMHHEDPEGFLKLVLDFLNEDK
ncbi:protein ABHD11-like [Scaptodrosophila lebanonensis]|uniref:sn-1-specific diacylglycerol lipase ABHD11 n=1 Tax=Drosophila lebanonensis TaxID=7225 RepID=A0A6J2THZ1_DROLE|nr:protein ABHD11-like [Scaptodrosophila lebanonensis]